MKVPKPERKPQKNSPSPDYLKKKIIKKNKGDSFLKTYFRFVSCIRIRFPFLCNYNMFAVILYNRQQKSSKSSKQLFSTKSQIYIKVKIYLKVK